MSKTVSEDQLIALRKECAVMVETVEVPAMWLRSMVDEILASRGAK